MIAKILQPLINLLKNIKHWTVKIVSDIINYIRNSIDRYRDDLTAAEHSTLVFLCLSIQAAPHKTSDLLKLAIKDDIYHNPKGRTYSKMINRLAKSLDNGTLLNTVQKIRKELQER